MLLGYEQNVVYAKWVEVIFLLKQGAADVTLFFEIPQPWLCVCSGHW